MPDEVRVRVAGLRDRLQAALGDGGADVPARIDLVRELEELDAELSGRDVMPVRLYVGGRLGTIWRYDPIRIQGAVNTARADQHVARYLERIDRANARFHWFYVRAGLETEAAPELKPWEQPYGAMEEDHELIWGRVTGTSSPGGGGSGR